MKKILVVDDSNSSRTSLVFSLSQKGFQVIAAEDGKQGLNQAVDNEDLTIIITDINMPNMNGFEMIENIRKFNQEVPIIALSVDEAKGNQAIQSGATAFIIKSSKSSEEIKRFLDLYIK